MQVIFEHILKIIEEHQEDNQWQRVLFRLCQIGLQLACSFHDQLKTESIEKLFSLTLKLIKKQQLFRKEIETLLALSLQCAEHIKANSLVTDYNELKIDCIGWKLSPNHAFAKLTDYLHLLSNNNEHQKERLEEFARHQETLREALKNETKSDFGEFSQRLDKRELKFVCEVVQPYAIARFHETTKYDVIEAIKYWREQPALIRHLLEIALESLVSCRGRTSEEFTHTWKALSPFVDTLMQEHPALVLSLFAIRIHQAQQLNASDLLTASWNVIIPQLDTLLSNLKIPTYDIPLAWWQTYRTELKKARDAFYMAEQMSKNLELAQEEYTEACCNLLKRMWKNNVSLLGEPPCAMEFIVLGSMSRGDMQLYSDCEAMLLVEKAPSSAEIAAYLQLQAWLLNYHLLSLGEDPNIQSLPAGFHVDKALSWLGSAASDLSDFANNHFIQRPKVEVLPNYYITKATNQPEILYQDIAYFSLLQPKSILSDETLLAMYQSNLNTWINQPTTVEAKKRLKLPNQLALTWKAFMCLGQWQQIKIIEPIDQINIKEFARPLVVWANTLKLWYDIKETHPVKIFQSLEDLVQSDKKVSSVWSIALMRLARITLQRLNEIRFLVQKENQSQHEIIKQTPGDGNFFPMSPEIRQELSCIHKMVLIPWQTAINIYFNSLTKLPAQGIARGVADVADENQVFELPDFFKGLFQALTLQTEIGLNLGVKTIQYLLNEPMEVGLQQPVVFNILQVYYTALQQLLDKTLDLLPDNRQIIHPWLQTVLAFVFKPKASESHSAFSELVLKGIVEPFYKGYQTQLEKLNDSHASLNSVEWLNLLQTSYISYLNYREDWYKRWQLKKVDTFLLLTTHPLITVCRQKPASNGWSPYHEYRKQAWYSKLTKLFTLSEEQINAKGTCTIAGYPLTALQPNADEIYVLPAEISEQLFEPESGKVRGDEKYSSEVQKSKLLNFLENIPNLVKKTPSSQVRRINNYQDIDVFFKVKEGNRECLLGREIAVSCLHQLLGGTLAIAPGWPVCLTYITPKNKVHTYWACVSETVDGKPLGEVMLNDDLDNITIDPVSYSQLFLLTLLTFPEDGQPLNFILQQQKAGIDNYRLIAIDNGQSFVNPWEPGQQTDQVGVLNIKSMVFLLPNLQQPLATEVIEGLLLLDVGAVIENWKAQLTAINNHFKGLLEKQLAAARVKPADWPSYNALIDLSGKQIDFTFISLRLSMIQAWLRKHQTATAMELFHYIDPLIAGTYQEKYKNFKGPKDYYQLNPKAYMVKPAVEKIQQGDYQASSRHYSAIVSNTLCMDYLKRDNQVQKYIIEFLSTISWKDLLEKQQQFFLEIISRISFTEKLNLAGCKALDDGLLENILKKSPELKEINLKDCTAITNKSWIALGKLCKKIRVIDIRNTPGISNLETVNSGFNNLRTLYSSLSQEAIGISLNNIELRGPTLLKWSADNPYNYVIKLVLAGLDVAAGQTCCRYRYAENLYRLTTTTTIKARIANKIIQINSNENCKVQIWDTGRPDRFNTQRFYYSDTHVFIFVLDITQRSSLERIAWRVEEVRECTHHDVPIILMANKCDLEEQRQFTYEEGVQLAQKVGALLYTECSAKEGTNVEAAFTFAVQAAIDKYYKGIEPFILYTSLEQPDIETIQQFIKNNPIDNPCIWYSLKIAISKLDKLQNNLLITILRRGLRSKHHIICRFATELAIQFNLTEEINQSKYEALAESLIDPKNSFSDRQTAHKELEEKNQFDNPNILKIFGQGLESHNAEQQQFAAEKLIDIGKFDEFEAKILYVLGKSLAHYSTLIAAKQLLLQLNKLTASEVAKGLIDELDVSNEIMFYRISKKIIKYGHFSTYAQQITDALIKDLFGYQYKSYRQNAKELLQKILDEKLYSDDVKLKETIEAAFLTVQTNQTAYEKLKNDQKELSTEHAYDYTIKLVVAGSDTAVGQTCCVMRYTENHFIFTTTCTIAPEFGNKIVKIYPNESCKVNIWDVSSYERHIGRNCYHYRNTHVFIFILDITRRSSLDRTAWRIELVRKYSTNDVPIILMGNKCDLEDQRQFTYEEGIQLAYKVGALLYTECSAKDGTNVKKAFTLAIEAAIDKYYKGIDPLIMYNNLEQPDIKTIKRFIKNNPIDNPCIWYSLKVAISKLDTLQDKLIIATLRKGLNSKHHIIRQFAGDLLIQFNLTEVINQMKNEALAESLIDPNISISSRQKAHKELEDKNQFDNLNILTIFSQGLESTNAKERYLAAEVLINIKKFEMFETKILYALGKNLVANYQIKKASEILLKQINKLTSFEVSECLIDELNISEGISIYVASKVIKYGYFSKYSQQITDALLKDLYHHQFKDYRTKVKDILKKIIDEKLYGDDIKLKECIEAELEKIKVHALTSRGEIKHLAVPPRISDSNVIANKSAMNPVGNKSILIEKPRTHKIVLTTFYFTHVKLINEILTANLPFDNYLTGATGCIFEVNDFDNNSHKFIVWALAEPERYDSLDPMFFRGSNYLLCGYSFYGEEFNKIIKRKIESYIYHSPENPIVLLACDFLPQEFIADFSLDFIRSVKEKYKINHLHIVDPEDMEFEILWVRQWLLSISLEAHNWITLLQSNLIERFSERFPKAFAFAKEFMVIEYDRKTAIEILQPLNFVQLDRFTNLIMQYQPASNTWVTRAYQENAKRLLFVALSKFNLCVAQRANHLITKGTLLDYNREHTIDNTMWRIMAEYYFNDDELIKLAKSLKSNITLKELHLAKNKIDHLSMQVLVNALSNNQSLISLDISSNELTSYSGKCLTKFFENNTSLVHLNLSNNKLDDEGVKTIMSSLCKGKMKLQTLNLSNTNLTSDSCHLVASYVYACHQLQHLDLSNNTIDNLLSLVSATNNFPNQLVSLNLSKCKIKEEALDVFVNKLDVNNHLNDINLSDNQFKQTTFPILANLINRSPKLKQLDIRGLKGASDIKFLQVLRQSKVTKLYCGDNCLTKFHEEVKEILANNEVSESENQTNLSALKK